MTALGCGTPGLRILAACALLLCSHPAQAVVPPDIGPGHSGSWYNPAQSGHGFSMEFGATEAGEPLAVVYWYTYDDRGDPLFLAGQGRPEANRLAVDLYSPVGMEFGAFDPGTVSRQPGGTAVFEFDDRENGSFSYAPSEFTRDNWGHLALEGLPIARLFGVPAPATFEWPDTGSCAAGEVNSPFPDYNEQPLPPDRTGMGSTASEMAARIRLGWNIGNTLEAIGGETAWGNPAVTPGLLRLVKDSGFDAVRIPASWDQYADPQTARIDPAWLERVRTVVQYALDIDLAVILNIHWDGGWLENHVTQDKRAENVAKQRAFWQQIATHLRDFDERLMFAGTNEPNVDDAEQMTVLYDYHQAFVDAVRCTGGKNAWRVLVVQGPATDIEKTDALWTGMPFDSVPDRLMAEVHFYTPYNFTLMSADEDWGNQFFYWGEGNHSATDTAHNPTWGEEETVDALLASMKARFVQRGIPVIVGEFSPTRRSNLEGEALELHLKSRAYYLEYVTRAALANGLVPFYWDNGVIDQPGSGLFDRYAERVFDAQAIEALVRGAEQ